MPTYEYECEACGKTHEAFQGMREEPLRKCPHCGEMRLRRLVSAGAGFLFKGSGFYVTDYRSKEYTEQAKKESAASSTSSASTASPASPGSSSDPGKSSSKDSSPPGGPKK